MTLTTIRDRIILDAEIENNPLFPPSRLLVLINEAQKYVQSQLIGLGFKKWLKSSTAITPTATTFNGTSIKRFPMSSISDLLEGTKIKYIACNDGSNYGMAYEVNDDKLKEHLRNSLLSPTVKYPIFSRIDQYVYLAPSDITQATVYYHGIITDLAADDDETLIPSEYIELLIKRVLLEIDSIMGRLNDKAEAINQLNKEIADIYKNMQIQRVEESRDEAKLQ